MSPSKCNNLLLSTYQYIVQLFPSMMLFFMLLSYVLRASSWDLKVFVYRSYHTITDSIIPYTYLNSHRYSTLMLFFLNTFFLCYVFTFHIISKNSPSFLNMMNSPFGMSALRYAPGTSKMATPLPSCESITRLMNIPSKDIIGDDSYSLIE